MGSEMCIRDSFFSLHDLTKHKLAYVCCRKTSTKCKIKVIVAWDDLERVAYYKEDNIRVSVNLNGNIMYEAKGFHSPSCVAKFDFLARKAMMKSLEEKKQRNAQKYRTGPEHGEIEKNVRKALDGRKPFFLQQSKVQTKIGMRTVLLLGSKFMIEQLLKCKCLFIDQTKIALDYQEETWLLSILGMDSKGAVSYTHLTLPTICSV